MADDRADLDGRDEPRPYPPYVSTDEQRRRWDLAEAIAAHLHADDGAAMIWQATRVIFWGKIETGE